MVTSSGLKEVCRVRREMLGKDKAQCSLSLSLFQRGEFISAAQSIEQGRERSPWDLICTGVHLVEVVPGIISTSCHICMRAEWPVQ